MIRKPQYTGIHSTAVTAQKFMSTFDNLGYSPLDQKLARAVSIKIHTRSETGRVVSSTP